MARNAKASGDKAEEGRTTTVHVPATGKFRKDLEELRSLLHAPSVAEAIRRACARELLLLRELKRVRSILLRGEKEDGEDLRAILD